MLLFAVVPLIIIAISIPLIKGIVPRNHWYGFRTSKTLSSDSVWYQANRIGGNYFVIAGLVQLAAMLIAYLVSPAAATRLIKVYGGALITVPLLVAVVVWFVRIRRI